LRQAGLGEAEKAGIGAPKEQAEIDHRDKPSRIEALG